MSSFWFSALLLLLFAVLLVFLPWWLSRHRQNRETLSNTGIVRQRLQELERECAEGLIGNEDKVQAIEELKLALVDESSDCVKAEKVPVGLVSVVMVVTLLLSVAVYWQANQLDKLLELDLAQVRLSELSQRIVMQADKNITAADIEDFALGVRDRLSREPQDATGWMLLGRLHMALRQVEQALQAFAKSEQLQPENLSNLSSYSQALLMTGQQESLLQAQGLLQRILQLSPEDNNAHLMLALVAAELGNKELGRIHFAAVQGKLPESDPIYQSLTHKLGITEVMAKSAASPQQLVENTTGLVINVQLDKQLTSKLPKQGYLFVFAQNADGGSRMPAAVVRQPLAALPLTVTLTDADAMLPDFTLSQLKNTRLIARISRDGNVAQAVGELQGETLAIVQPGVSSHHNIIINKEIM